MRGGTHAQERPSEATRIVATAGHRCRRRRPATSDGGDTGGGDMDTVECAVDEVDGDLALFNWAEYIDPDQLQAFADEYGISATMDVYDSNEAMQPIIAAGGSGDERYVLRLRRMLSDTPDPTLSRQILIALNQLGDPHLWNLVLARLGTDPDSVPREVLEDFPITGDDGVRAFLEARLQLAQRHADHLALGLLGGFANGLGDLFRFTFAEADTALLVAHNHQSGEAKALTTLYGLGHTVDRHQAVCKFRGLVALAAAIVPTVVISCHEASFHSGTKAPF